MISHKHKFIFIHIPKTGGTSIERVLDTNIQLENPDLYSGHVEGNTLFDDKHWTTIDYQQNFPKLFDSYFKFMFIRNPWDRMVSQYEWRNLAICLKSKIELPEKISKQDFKSFLQRQEGWRYIDLMQDKKGNRGIDFVGRFENLQEDFNIVCDKIGIPRQQLSHYNKTKHKHYTEYYDDETREIVAEKYAKDIEYFGYKFENYKC